MHDTNTLLCSKCCSALPVFGIVLKAQSTMYHLSSMDVEPGNKAML